MTMTFVNSTEGKRRPPKPEEPRCYVVAMYLNGNYVGYFKAVYPDNWDCMEPYSRYHYTRHQAIDFFRNGDAIDEQILRSVVEADMSIYSGDWEYHLDGGKEAVYITAKEMETIFVDKWNHRDLS